MTKSITLRLLNFIIGCIVTLSLQGQSDFQLTISFSGITSDQGKMMIKVQDKTEKDVAKLVLPISSGKASTSIILKKGKYGVSAFHDENENEKIDLSFIGVPTEVYGFSNNARGTFGKPPYDETLIDLTSNKSITIKLE